MDDIDIFICHECAAIFFFSEDLEDHKMKTGHKVSSKKTPTFVKIGHKVIVFFDAA